MNEDHGLSGLLLQEIINDFIIENKKAFEKIQVNAKIGDLSKYDIKIIPEFSVFTNNEKSKRRDIDILIEIYETNSETPIYSICLENKITDSSIIKKENQLQEELKGLENYYNENDINTEIYLVYLTPQPSKISSESFNKLDYKNKAHLYWDADENSIIEKLMRIMQKENVGIIDPITAQAAFLIKSFIAFIRTGFKSYQEEKSEKSEKKNYGKAVLEHLHDFAKSLEHDKIYDVDKIRNEFSAYVEHESGVALHKRTRDAHILKATVNEKNRIHYNVNRPDDERSNIFYYPDSNDRKKIALFNKDKHKNILIEYKGRD